MTRADKFEEIFGYRPATDHVLCNELDYCGESDACNYCMCNPNNIGDEEDWWNAEYKESTTKNDLGVDAVSRQFMRELGATCIATRDKNNKLIALGTLDDLPSVTPQPEIGKWIDDKCSVCGKGTEDLISSHEWYINEEPNFCPFCGVKLESER